MYISSRKSEPRPRMTMGPVCFPLLGRRFPKMIGVLGAMIREHPDQTCID